MRTPWNLGVTIVSDRRCGRRDGLARGLWTSTIIDKIDRRGPGDCRRLARLRGQSRGAPYPPIRGTHRHRVAPTDKPCFIARQ